MYDGHDDQATGQGLVETAIWRIDPGCEYHVVMKDERWMVQLVLVSYLIVLFCFTSHFINYQLLSVYHYEVYDICLLIINYLNNYY